MNQLRSFCCTSLPRWLAICGLGLVAVLNAQESSDPTEVVVAPTVPTPPLEEVKVVGKKLDSETDVEYERILLDVQADYLDSDFIGRIGDSDAAALLRRMPGLTLNQGKFIYVRSLGERYSSAQLNGSVVPSPDITRNVVPLDIFPADIIDSMKVQKGYSPDLAASFGGGNIDIRTKRVPEAGLFHVAFKTGTNSESGNGLSYPGGSTDWLGVDDGTRALPTSILEAISTYKGSLSPITILRSAVNTPYDGDIDVAKQTNRQLATLLNRNIDLTVAQTNPDLEGEFLAGYRHYINDSVDFGVLALGSHAQDVRNRERVVRRISNPKTDFAESLTTTQAVNITGSLNIGLRYTEDHELGSIHLFLRNTDDDATSTRTCSQGQFNDCFDESSAVQGRLYGMRFEQRDLAMHQLQGSHTFGDPTLAILPEIFEFLRDTEFSWYYTAATASADLPHEVGISGQEGLNAPDGAPVTFSVRTTATAAEFRYSALNDEIESYGWDASVPYFLENVSIELSAGYDYLYKLRNYRQTSFGLGSSAPSFNQISSNTPSMVFAAPNVLNPVYDMELIVGIGAFGSESYIADQFIEAGYGKIDVLINETWRLSGGVRGELFEQAVLPIDYLRFDGTAQDSAGYSRLSTKDVYPSVGLTYIRPAFWADEFQLRGGVSKTVARPDIREMSASTFIDPLTEARVRGNPELVTSDLVNFDVRGEWFWRNSDMLSVSLFHKDIAKPIESVQGGATEDNIRINFVNARRAAVSGLEIEWKKSLSFLEPRLGKWAETWYVAGNGTVSDSEIYIPVGQGVGALTNERRRMTQHSPWVLNLQLGFDAPNRKHSGLLAFNSFGERVFFAGISGQDDGFEQPFDSLDFVYSYYPTESLSFKLRVRNILQSSVEIKQDGISVIEQKVGSTLLLNAKWEL